MRGRGLLVPPFRSTMGFITLQHDIQDKNYMKVFDMDYAKGLAEICNLDVRPKRSNDVCFEGGGESVCSSSHPTLN